MDGTDTTQEWAPVTLGIARDRSAAGWMFTRIEDVCQAFSERQLVAAVQPKGPAAATGLIQARIAVREDGSVATLPEPGGPPVPGAHITEVIGELAHAMRTTIGVDGQVLIGPAGVPLEDVPTGMGEDTDDRRTVYAWPGTDRYVATAAVMGVKEPLTWHDAEDWTVLASEHAPQRVLTGFVAAMERFPRVTLRRRGPERVCEYAAGKGEQDLQLGLWWAPWMDPLVDPAGADQDTRSLLETLAHPRLGQDLELALDHPDLTEDQRHAMHTALEDRDGSTFLARMTAALEVPAVAARLAEQQLGEDDPDLVGEPVEAAQGRVALVRETMKEMQATGEEPPFARKVVNAISWVELVVGLVFLAGAWLGFLPGPGWIWLIAGALLTGDGLKEVVIDPWRERRRSQR